MSMRAYDSEETSNAIAQTAARAASMIDDGVHRGADAVASAAHQTADQVGRASDYMWKKSGRVRERAASVAEIASQHPAYSWIALGLVAFGLGYFLRGSRTGAR
jgi:fatty acid-binding protein DegV